MSAAANSNQIPASRTRVTDVCRVTDAVGIDSIMVAGNTVAIHFATKHGIEIMRCPRWSFIDKAQSPTDHHGHPFRGVATDMAALEKDAEQVPITKGNPADEPVRGHHYRCGTMGLSPETRSKLRGIYDARQRDEDTRKQVEIAAQLGIHPSTVSAYFSRFRSDDLTFAPITKPNGRIL